MKFYQKTWFKALAAVFLIWLIHGMVAAWPAEQEKAKQEVAAKQETKTEQKAPAKPLKFDKAIADTVADLKNREFHKYTLSARIDVNEEKKEVIMSAVMMDGLKKWMAMEFADTMIRKFSSNAATYNDSLTPPGNDNYGSLFDTYSIHIGVAPQSQVDKPENWYYEKVIYPKMHTKQGPDWKKAQKENK